MELPKSLLNSSLIKEKSVFYFSTSKISSPEPHNFVLVKCIDSSIIAFTCCTTNYNTIYKYIIRNGYPEETVASLDYNNYPFLSSPTYINCNSKTEFDYTEFLNLYQKGKVKYKGEISDEEYTKIVEGILLSEDIEEEFKMAISISQTP